MYEICIKKMEDVMKAENSKYIVYGILRKKTSEDG